MAIEGEITSMEDDFSTPMRMLTLFSGGMGRTKAGTDGGEA